MGKTGLKYYKRYSQKVFFTVLPQQIHQTQVGGVSTVISNHGAIVGHIWDVTLSPLTSSIKGPVAEDGILPFCPILKDEKELQDILFILLIKSPRSPYK